MPKRMTDTNKWKNHFFKSLPLEYKMFWIYLLDDCNHAGIWDIDMEVAQIRLGTKLSIEKARGLFGKRVVEIDGGTKWFLPDFLEFQYGVLNEKNSMYRSILPYLAKHNLTPGIPRVNPGEEEVTVKVTVKEKEEAFLKNEIWKDQFCAAKGVKKYNLEQMQKKMVEDLRLKGTEISNYQSYFVTCFDNGVFNGMIKRMVH